MTTITVKIPNILGESVVAAHADELDAVAVRDGLGAPVGSGKAFVSEVLLTRHRDKGSPKLAEACAAATNLGTVEVFLFKNVDGSPKTYFKYELTNTYVSRIEHETAEGHGGAYMAHGGFSGSGGLDDDTMDWLHTNGYTMNDIRSYSRKRARPQPYFPQPIAASSTNSEVERVWLSPATVTWTYTPYDANGVAQGAVQKQWNVLTGSAVL